MTSEEILNRMLSRIPDSLDKRKGGIIYLALAPASYEIALIIEGIKKTVDMGYADTAIGDDLTRRAAERGIRRKQATKAVRKGNFNLDVPMGSRFGLETTTYKVIENLPNNEAKLQCEQFGEIGNIYTGDLLPITYIPGLTTAQLVQILIPGEDVEEDESLRARYFDNLESAPYGGNKADYKQKTRDLAGVGGVKVYPVWNGGGTVKLVIIDSQYNKPSTVLVDTIQTSIDPIVNNGLGLGIAPIGHFVTVDGVEEVIVNISSNITLVVGYLWDDVEPYIRSAIDEYFLNLKKTWESEEALVVRISQIESFILKVTGVLDIQNTTLNGSNTNLILTDVQIPILGMMV